MKTFSIGLLILTLVICDTQAKVNPQDYIELVSFPVEHQTELRWIVDKIEERTSSDSEQDFVKFFAEAKAESVNAGDYQKKVILDVFDPTSVSSSSSHDEGNFSFDAKCFIDLTTVAFGSFKNYISLVKSKKLPQKNVKLFNYLKEYGYNKWQKCLSSNTLQISFFGALDKLDKVAERAFDELFKTNEEYPSESKLNSVVEKVDFVKGKLNGKYMMSAMKKYLEEFTPNVKTNANMLVNYLHQLCDKMYPTLVEFFDGYNLARAILPDRPKTSEEDSPTFKKLHEYTRLCIQLMDSATSKIAAEKITKSVS